MGDGKRRKKTKKDEKRRKKTKSKRNEEKTFFVERVSAVRMERGLAST